MLNRASGVRLPMACRRRCEAWRNETVRNYRFTMAREVAVGRGFGNIGPARLKVATGLLGRFRGLPDWIQAGPLYACRFRAPIDAAQAPELTAANCWYQVDFAVRRDGCEPDILKNFPVNGNGKAVLLEVGCQRRITLAQRAQQLLHVLHIDLDDRIASGQLPQAAVEEEAGQRRKFLIDPVVRQWPPARGVATSAVQ